MQELSMQEIEEVSGAFTGGQLATVGALVLVGAAALAAAPVAAAAGLGAAAFGLNMGGIVAGAGAAWLGAFDMG